MEAVMQQVYVLLGKRLSHDSYLAKKGSDPNAWALHPDAQLRVDALAAISRQAPVDLLICSGGETAGFGLPSEAYSLSRGFLASDFGPRCPKILLDEESLNTTENALYVKKLLVGVQYFTLHVITSGYHAARVKEIFLAQHINIEVLPAEDVVGNLVPERKAEMLRYKKSLHVRAERVREWVSRMLPKGFLTKLAHFFR
jgi:uncharacterized SAM-binding protein YcdF (DUF218 family)